jgi:hypothetical protein
MRRSSILAAFLFLSCCHDPVTSRLLPQEDGSVSVVSVAREESPAAARNVIEANRYCEKQSRKAVFGEEQTEYQGVLTKRGEPLARIAKNIPGVGSKVTSDEDFRVTTSFKCIVTE